MEIFDFLPASIIDVTTSVSAIVHVQCESQLMSPELRSRDVPSAITTISTAETANGRQKTTPAQQSTPKRRGRPPRNSQPVQEEIVSTPADKAEMEVIDDSMETEEQFVTASEQTSEQGSTTPMDFMDTLRDQVSPTLPPVQSARNTPDVSDSEMADQNSSPPSPKKKRGKLVKGSVRHAAALPPPPTPFKVATSSNPQHEFRSTLFFTQQEYNDLSVFTLQKPFEILKANTTSNKPSGGKLPPTVTTPKATTSSRPYEASHDVLGGLLTSMSAQTETRINSRVKSKASQDPMSVDQDPLVTTPSDRLQAEYLDDLSIAASAAGVSIPSIEVRNTTSGQHPPAKQARRSKFRKEEQLKFMQTGELLKSNPSLVSEKDRQFYTKMSREVTEENNEFMQWQKAQIRESDVMNKVDPNIARIVDQHYAQERERVSQFPGTYEFHKTINVFAKVLAGHEPILQHKLLLKRQGRVCRCDLPSKLPIVVPFKDTYFAAGQSQEEAGGYIKSLDVRIALDPNIPKMVTDNGVNVVATSKSLSSIVALEKDRESALDVPIKIVETQIADRNSFKTVYIDDPFTEPVMDNRQRAQIVYDAAFRAITLNCNQRQSIEHQEKPQSDDATSKTGAGVPFGSTIQSPMMKSDLGTDVDSPIGSTTSEGNDKSSELNNDNTIYNLWTFGDINLLVRWHADGYISESDKTGTSETRMVSLKSKVDFYMHAGYKEIMTAGDRARHWMTSYLQGHAPIFEGRVDPTTNQLVRIERKEMVDIMGDRWRPVQESEMLRQLLIKLRGLDAGDYLLRYSKRNHVIDIWKHSKDAAAKGYNLHQRYQDVKIDPELTYIPAWSGSKEQIPFTFPIGSSSASGNKKQHKHGARRSFK